MSKLTDEMTTKELEKEHEEIQDEFVDEGICQCCINRLLELERELVSREEQP